MGGAPILFRFTEEEAVSFEGCVGREAARGGLLDYAIVRAGGMQYSVSVGATIRVPKMKGDIGEKVALSEVLVLRKGESVAVGAPQIESAAVSAEIVRHGRAQKIIVYKKKRRKGYQRKRGHRQGFTELLITAIESPQVSP